ncbi:MAG TPA: hypothetical protein VF616_25620 [Duganella sp.]|jgi:hypothetical protein|uniref:hypothetical protein n=1 Tax=Duganella sp. TaxID=1904440 RepID=UPI002ED1B4A2
MKTALGLLALLGLAGCASGGMGEGRQALQSSAAVPQRSIVEAPGMLKIADVPLKPMTASQSAARMN